MTENYPFSVIPVPDTGIHSCPAKLHGCRIKSGMTTLHSLSFPCLTRESILVRQNPMDAGSSPA